MVALDYIIKQNDTAKKITLEKGINLLTKIANLENSKHKSIAQNILKNLETENFPIYQEKYIFKKNSQYDIRLKLESIFSKVKEKIYINDPFLKNGDLLKLIHYHTNKDKLKEIKILTRYSDNKKDSENRIKQFKLSLNSFKTQFTSINIYFKANDKDDAIKDRLYIIDNIVYNSSYSEGDYDRPGSIIEETKENSKDHVALFDICWNKGKII